MIVVLLGPPGAGKGTQADMLVAQCGFQKVSTGDALRRQIQSGTELGKRVKGVMAEGKLVSDDILLEVLKSEFEAMSAKNMLLDGYPRNLNQAETLQSLKAKYPVNKVIHLDVDNQELIKRLSGRRTCTKCGSSFHVDFKPPLKGGVCDNCQNSLVQRDDDLPEKIAVRLRVYDENTKPVIDFYKKQHLYSRIDGHGSTNEVFAELRKLVN